MPENRPKSTKARAIGNEPRTLGTRRRENEPARPGPYEKKKTYKKRAAKKD